MTLQTALDCLKKQQQHIIETNKIVPPNLQTKVPTLRKLLQSNGFDWASKHGVLEPYKDAWGETMHRDKHAWDQNWATLIDEQNASFVRSSIWSKPHKPIL